MIILRSDLKETIRSAVKELYDAPDKHNFGSHRVKVYVSPAGRLYHTIQQSDWTNEGDLEILRFNYTCPAYNTEQAFLDECNYIGTIADWDWDNFTSGEDFNNYVEELFDKAKEKCWELDIQIF